MARPTANDPVGVGSVSSVLCSSQSEPNKTAIPRTPSIANTRKPLSIRRAHRVSDIRCCYGTDNDREWHADGSRSATFIGRKFVGHFDTQTTLHGKVGAARCQWGRLNTQCLSTVGAVSPRI